MLMASSHTTLPSRPGPVFPLRQGSASPTEFYKRNHRWTEGLISAAKAVGLGAKSLLYVTGLILSLFV